MIDDFLWTITSSSRVITVPVDENNWILDCEKGVEKDGLAILRIEVGITKAIAASHQTLRHASLFQQCWKHKVSH